MRLLYIRTSVRVTLEGCYYPFTSERDPLEKWRDSGGRKGNRPDKCLHLQVTRSFQIVYSERNDLFKPEDIFGDFACTSSTCSFTPHELLVGFEIKLQNEKSFLA